MSLEWSDSDSLICKVIPETKDSAQLSVEIFVHFEELHWSELSHQGTRFVSKVIWVGNGAKLDLLHFEIAGFMVINTFF